MRFSKRDLVDAELPMFSASGLDQRDLVTLVWSAYREAFGLEKSRSEASRLIKQGSIELDGQTVRDPKAIVQVKSGQILRLDKRHAVRIT
jgi:tyrosyl-tRNA synthetase